MQTGNNNFITAKQVQQMHPNLPWPEQQAVLNKIPIDRIPDNEVVLYIPIHDLTIEDGMKLYLWSRMAHQIISEQNLRKMLEISRRGETAYRDFLENIQDRYQEQEQLLAYQWRENNPMQPRETLASWTNQSRLAAREILTNDLVKELT